MRAWMVLTLFALSLGSSQVAAQQAPTFPTLPADLPAGEGQTHPCLDALEGEVLCGRFRVYENRGASTGRTIDLAFVVLKALNDRGHSDAYTQFNGGPGAPTTGSAAAMARFRADVRRDRDILLIDHRGTGNSAGLHCDTPYPGGVSSRFQTVFPLDHVDACRTMLSEHADLAQYTTPIAMDDLAELSAWLGYTQLDLSGGSYGTREAQSFTRRHPEMVRTVILNGVAPVDERIYVYHARYLQDALENLFGECEARTACRAAYPDLRTATNEVLNTAKDSPPEVEVEGTRVPFGIGPLSYALRGLLYGQSGTVPARIYDARSGNWQPLADYYLARQAWVGAPDGPTGYHYSTHVAADRRGDRRHLHGRLPDRRVQARL
jgi:pimeloyl-ACP methyl ester carboxylesterase